MEIRLCVLRTQIGLCFVEDDTGRVQRLVVVSAVKNVGARSIRRATPFTQSDTELHDPTSSVVKGFSRPLLYISRH